MMGLREVTFCEDKRLPYPQPIEMRAHENGIALMFSGKRGGVTHAFLSPRHINTLLAMCEAWWLERWEQLYEEQG